MTIRNWARSNSITGKVQTSSKRNSPDSYIWSYKPILVQCHISISPENVRKPLKNVRKTSEKRFQGV